MNSLFLEFVSCLLFLYFYVNTFFAEVFNGFFQSFLCVFGWVSVNESTERSLNLQPFYYTYVILISLMGNSAFIISLFIYGPICRLIKTPNKAQQPVSDSGSSGAAPKHVCNTSRNVLYFRRRPVFHICVFTRYDLYAFLVLTFICVQMVLQSMAAIDDFKPIERMVFKKTIAKHETNVTDCWSEVCDDLTGHQALKGIHRFQEDMQCCGWGCAEDWLSKDNSHSMGAHLPQSCCKDRSLNCSFHSKERFPIGCHSFELPVRSIIDPTRYGNCCYGVYPLFKLMAFLTYQFSFKRLFDGNALLLSADLSLPSTARFL